MPVETGALISHLEERENKEGTLPPLLQFYQKLLRVQSRVELEFTAQLASSPGGGGINEQIEHSPPLLAFNELSLDWPLLRDTFTRVIAIFAEYPELFGEPPRHLREPGAGNYLTKEVVRAWFEEARLPATILADSSQEDLLMAIIHATLKPFLVSHARALFGLVDQEHWRRNYCPICGGAPDFALLDKERGARWLLCSRCDTEWLYQRLECPYCSTRDQNALGYFTDEEDLYRLYVCERCKQYLKAIDLRQTTAEVLLPLERLYTLDIDRQAREHGYHPREANVKAC